MMFNSLFTVPHEDLRGLASASIQIVLRVTSVSFHTDLKPFMYAE